MTTHPDATTAQPATGDGDGVHPAVHPVDRPDLARIYDAAASQVTGATYRWENRTPEQRAAMTLVADLLDHYTATHRGTAPDPVQLAEAALDSAYAFGYSPVAWTTIEGHPPTPVEQQWIRWAAVLIADRQPAPQNGPDQ